MAANEIIINGFAPPGKEKYYQDVPFEMPSGVARLDVEYTYSDVIDSDPTLSGGNTLDIGLFDERGDAFLNGASRGWSGSERSQIFIAPTEATPGYIPGPLNPGIWHVCLGFYKVAPKGCNYQVKVRFTFGDVPEARFPELLHLSNTVTPIPQHASGWYKGELHCHTYNSDGDSAPADVVAQAIALGLDFLAITDHNNFAHLVDLAKIASPNIVLIPGCEVTTFKGHWNLWGELKEWVDFRILTPEQMEAAFRFANDCGYLTSLNHPRVYGPPWEFEDVKGNRCLEVWNGPWRLFNEQALNYWLRRLAGGEQLVAVGGSDMHQLKTEHHAHLGIPTMWIYTSDSPTAANILAGLRAGHAFVTESPTGPQLYLSANGAMMGDTLPLPSDCRLNVQVRVVEGEGARLELHGLEGCLHSQLIEANDVSLEIPHSITKPGYIRAQLVLPADDEFVLRALTNPIYLAK